MEAVAKTAKQLAQKPGVYLYYDQTGQVIYVGKAKNLRARVSSYFRPSADLQPSKRVMIGEISRLDTIIVRSDTEAVLLESTLIKKYRPKYNVILKDDKFFQYIRVALAEDYPSVSTVRRVTLDGSRYFGPYPSGFAVRQTMKLLKRLFPYKSCPNRPEIPCFDAQLGRCLGHDLGPGSRARYRQVVDQFMDFLNGHTGTVLKDLRRVMKRAAKDQDYEEAARYRDRLDALEHMMADQAVVTNSRQSFDVIGLARNREHAIVALLQVRNGKLVQRDTHPVQHPADEPDPAVMQAFVSQYYSQSTNHPDTVIVPCPIDPSIGRALQLQTISKVRGTKRKLLEMANENANDTFEQQKRKSELDEKTAKIALSDLAHALNLSEPPKRIEMYDVSNIQGKHVVASMVVFTNGLPDRPAYRKFAIKNQAIPDDMHRLAEVLRRRFARHDDSGWPMPQLLLLDGGKPQLSVVLEQVPGLGQHVLVAALAKENEELFMPGQSESLLLPRDSAELRLIQSIRDEAHRFAIGFYRKKHRQESLRSMLDDIPGLGPQGKKKLLDTFGTLSGIRQASDEKLHKLLGSTLTKKVREQLG